MCAARMVTFCYRADCKAMFARPNNLKRKETTQGTPATCASKFSRLWVFGRFDVAAHLAAKAVVCSRTSEHRHQLQVLDLRVTGLKQSQQSGIPLKQSLSTSRFYPYQLTANTFCFKLPAASQQQRKLQSVHALHVCLV